MTLPYMSNGTDKAEPKKSLEEASHPRRAEEDPMRQQQCSQEDDLSEMSTEVKLAMSSSHSSLANANNSNNNSSTNRTMTTTAVVVESRTQRMLMPSGGSRFGGLSANVEASVSASVDKHLGSLSAPFPVTATDLGNLSSERTRSALADLLERGICSGADGKDSPYWDMMDGDDVESPNVKRTLQSDVKQLVERIRAAEANEHLSPEDAAEAEKNSDMAANVLTSILLRSSPESGIDPREVEHRRATFGSNAIVEKATDSFWKLCVQAVQDFVLIMLIVLGAIEIIVAVTTRTGNCSTCWIEGAAILLTVGIVVLVTAFIDYAKQFAFLRLTRSLHDTNTKQVIRDAKQVTVTDDDIVVGDILSVNSHNLASIPADCVLLGPPADLKMNEAALTGESKLISKKPGDVVLSGTNASQGSGRMVVIAVGTQSVAGKIKAQVYESSEHEGTDVEGDGDENSPLFVKLDLIAQRIGIAGTVAAAVSFIGSVIIGLAIQHEPAKNVLNYLVTAITVLAVAVPEGLPLAVTLALAFSSNKMMREQNLVKHLDACETMGCATTICTDKTGTYHERKWGGKIQAVGVMMCVYVYSEFVRFRSFRASLLVKQIPVTGTLTTNKMTARALYTGAVNYLVENPAEALGDFVRRGGIAGPLVDLICRAIAIDTMNETVLFYADGKSGRNVSVAVEGGSGNPTEVALLHMAHDMGRSYQEIRNTTKGRSDHGSLGQYLKLGKQYEFTSARKMMSWAVPNANGGYRLYCKGASEVVLDRCEKFVNQSGTYDEDLRDDMKHETQQTALAYARRGMRCIVLAYRDLSEGFNLDAMSATVTNSDGSEGFEAETALTCIALVGIEDPLRPEVPGAIEKCYKAGIDVRLVTGDNPNTAVSIAFQADILRDEHFQEGTKERVAHNLKPNVMMEGKVFRSKVHRVDADGNREFDQVAFDKIWPHLRVLARSSPDDKLTLAHGLNQSNLFADKELCARLEREDGIKIFPDRQVVAMTGDGTNDAPALKRADIGFAMGVAGTQIAKDAADIILLDDNFASIVTAAKWGRNVYASIQKFLQFQLTVNISAVVTALVGSFAYQQSPLAAIQLLWVNLIMDSLASLALASEPPVDDLLEKPPVNRTDSMITKRMVANMLGHASYQIAVIMTLLFAGPNLLNVQQGNEFPTGQGSEHYTIIFNTFVWMQLFNEINCRKVKGECTYLAASDFGWLFFFTYF